MRKIYVVMFLLVLTLTACGPKKVILNVTITNQGYDSSTYTVPAGEEVTVILTNKSYGSHIFGILKKGEHVTPPYNSTKDKDKIMWELIVQAEDTKSGTFTAPTEPGEYDIICRILGHMQQGMVATLIVK